MLSVDINSGLGNQLFQLAFLEYISKKTGLQFFITKIQPLSPHSRQNYFDSIFSYWKQFYRNDISIDKHYRENYRLAYEDWENKIDKESNCLIFGYFQRHEYVDFIKEDFFSRLFFNEKIKDKYPDIQNKFFIHIRGGDYLWHNFHNVKLEKYYEKCLNLLKDEEFVVFTNDNTHTKNILKNKEFNIIDENEEDCLYLMSLCKGGICSNSTFSWWGAYLNQNRPIYMPSKWFNDDSMNISGFYFTNVNIIDV